MNVITGKKDEIFTRREIKRIRFVTDLVDNPSLVFPISERERESRDCCPFMQNILRANYKNGRTVGIGEINNVDRKKNRTQITDKRRYLKLYLKKSF